MKKIVSFTVIILFIFASCKITTLSSESIPLTNSTSESMGVNNMSQSEIKKIFIDLINNSNDLYRWLKFDCHEDLDNSLQITYGVDEYAPNGFYWQPVNRFKTREELYDYTGKIYTEKYAKEILDWRFGDDLLSVEPNSTGDGWNEMYKTIFKEIDGRLYVRSDDIWENNTDYHKNINIIEVANEEENHILVFIYENEEQLRKNYARKYDLVCQDFNWLFADDGGY